MPFVGLGVGGMCRHVCSYHTLSMVSGNVPVYAAVFLGSVAIVVINGGHSSIHSPDFVPSSHQYLLTILSIWWCIGQLLGNLARLPLVSASFSSADYQQNRMASHPSPAPLLPIGTVLATWAGDISFSLSVA